MRRERLACVKGLLVSVSASAMLVAVSAGAQEGLDDPIPGSIRRGQVRVRLEPVAEGLTAPNWGTAVPGCHTLQDRLIVTDQDGIVWAGKFTAHLSGDEENPPVETQGQGEATFSFRGGSSALDFKLIVANLEDVVAAHVHCGAVDVNGPVGITLFSGGPTSADGVLAESTASAPDAGNDCGWTSLGDAEAAMRNGLAYVNVHTRANPAGEIRGQIR